MMLIGVDNSFNNIINQEIDTIGEQGEYVVRKLSVKFVIEVIKLVMLQFEIHDVELADGN